MTADVYATVAEAIRDNMNWTRVMEDGSTAVGWNSHEHLARAAVDALAGMGDVTDEQIGDAVSWDFAGKVAAVRALIAQARATDQARIAELAEQSRVRGNNVQEWMGLWTKAANSVLAEQARAEAAEATVERVRALRDSWVPAAHGTRKNGHVGSAWFKAAIDALDAALADGGEQDGNATS
jgi:hypothetical protein